MCWVDPPYPHTKVSVARRPSLNTQVHHIDYPSSKTSKSFRYLLFFFKYKIFSPPLFLLTRFGGVAGGRTYYHSELERWET